MKFSEVLGHSSLKDMFKRNIDMGRVPHSQMFVGDSGRGSLSLALSYVQYLYCKDRRGGDSCGVCASCYKIERMEHPDLHFIFPNNKSPHAKFYTSDGKSISDSLIELFRKEVISREGYISSQEWNKAMEFEGKNIQANIGRSDALELARKMGMKSYEGGYKCAIIWIAEKMNDSAANALLKLFEEPAPKTLFIFITHDREMIIKTILSRTQQIDIPPLDGDTLHNFAVENSHYDDQTIAKAIRISSGNLITFKNALFSNEDKSNLNFENFTSLMRLCYGQKYIDLIDWADSMVGMDRESQRDFFNYAVSMLRESYMKTIGMDNLTQSFGREDQFLQKFYPYIHHQNIEQLMQVFEKASFDLSRNGNQKMIFTHTALSISKLIRLAK